MSDIWYVRPYLYGGYGNGDGASYENAFNGFDKIIWANINEGNTLYICGNFTSGHLYVPMSNITIEGIDCHIDLANQQTTILFRNQTGIKFRDLNYRLFYCYADGSESNITFNNCSFRDGTGFAFFTMYKGNNNWSFINCVFEDGENGIYVNARNGIESVYNTIVRGCTFKHMKQSMVDAHAIGAQGGQGWIIEDNYIEDTGSAIMFYNEGGDSAFEMGDVIVRNNTIKNTTPESSGYGIAVCDPSEPNPSNHLTYQIYGNIIENTYGDGILITTLTEKPFEIYNNTIINAGQNGIRLNIDPNLKLIGEVYNNRIVNPVYEYIRVQNGNKSELNIYDNTFE